MCLFVSRRRERRLADFTNRGAARAENKNPLPYGADLNHGAVTRIIIRLWEQPQPRYPCSLSMYQRLSE